MREKRKKVSLVPAAALLVSSSVFSSLALGAAPRSMPSHALAAMPEAPGRECLPDVITAPPDTEDVDAAFTAGYPRRDVRIFIDGRPYPREALSQSGVCFVSPAEFLDYCGVISPVDAAPGEEFYFIDGRCVAAPEGVTEGGRVPLGSLAAAVGLCVSERDGDIFITGDAAPPVSGDGFYPKEDLYWLSRIIRAESQFEPLDGKIAVGNVVLNRVRSPSFPDDVKGVVFDRRLGVAQFSPASGDAIYVEPDRESVAAAKLCLEGVSLSDEILFFMNPALADSTWISDNRPAVMTIGRHTFYS